MVDFGAMHKASLALSDKPRMDLSRTGQCKRKSTGEVFHWFVLTSFHEHSFGTSLSNYYRLHGKDFTIIDVTKGHWDKARETFGGCGSEGDLIVLVDQDFQLSLGSLVDFIESFDRLALMPLAKSGTCLTCEYWKQASPAGDVVIAIGNCHAVPPVADKDGFGVWPLVNSDQDCGAYSFVEQIKV